jgi:quercetin dioxygenase-like cupin family protein
LKTLRTGDIYLIPSDIEHSAKAGDGPVQVIDIFTPIRQDFIY